MKAENSNIDWERTVIRELINVHRSAYYSHKVTLRPVAINLFDSEKLWGRFDPATRTISISRKLINEHPWHHVLGVLWHEMAHQLVEEEAPLLAEESTAHGPAFKQACKRLGIPEHFARAGVDLQEYPLDWRNEKHDEVGEKILDRVKKLLALANSTNEHEALLAMEKVRELYAKYNLEEVEKETRKDFVHLVITNGKKRIESWEQRTISILIEHFFVTVLTFRQFDIQRQAQVQALEIIGTKQNVLMAEYVYRFLVQQIEFLLKQKQTAGSDKFIGSDKRSFRLGVLDGFSKKLAAAEKVPIVKAPIVKVPGVKDPVDHGNSSLMDKVFGRKQPPRTELSLVGRALEQFRNDDALDDYLSEIYPRLHKRKSSSQTINVNAYSAGQAAGRSITLNRPLSGGIATSRNLRLGNSR